MGNLVGFLSLSTPQPQFLTVAMQIPSVPNPKRTQTGPASVAYAGSNGVSLDGNAHIPFPEIPMTGYRASLTGTKKEHERKRALKNSGCVLPPSTGQKGVGDAFYAPSRGTLVQCFERRRETTLLQSSRHGDVLFCLAC